MASLSNPAHPPRPPSRFIDWLSLAMAMLPLLAIAFDAWGIVYYRQGRRNEVMDFAPLALGVGIVLSFATAGLLLRGYALTKRSDARATFCWLLMPFVLMAWPAMCAMRPMPIEMYRRGLADWARANVDVGAIRGWHGTLPGTATPARVPVNLTIVPASVRGLHPSVIELHGNGILLQWGDVALMPGRQRKLFVAVDSSTQPPDEGRRFWVEVHPGVYVGAHGPP